MKNSFARIFATLALCSLCLTSCSKKPDACFTIEKGIPSSKLNDEVEVNAGCSSDADSFVWEWGDGASDTGIKAKHKYNAAATSRLSSRRRATTSRPAPASPLPSYSSALIPA